MRALGSRGHTEQEQEELARRIKTLRDALSRRMQTLMEHAMAQGGAMPDIGQDDGEGNDAFSRLMRRLQSDAASGKGEDAMRRLQDLENMTERMRNATPEDLASIARQLKAQAQAQAQRRALHDLVRQQTILLDHAQSRLGAQKRIQDEHEQNENGQDLANMPTSELLRRLGLKPPPGMESDTSPAPAPPPQETVPLDPATQAAHADQRRGDHATQRALHRVDRLLNDDVKELTGKPLEGLTKAHADMKKVRTALAGAHDTEAEAAEQQVLRDLAEAGKQMSEAQKGKSHGGGPIALLPTMGQGGHTQGAPRRARATATAPTTTARTPRTTTSPTAIPWVASSARAIRAWTLTGKSPMPIPATVPARSRRNCVDAIPREPARRTNSIIWTGC